MSFAWSDYLALARSDAADVASDPATPWPDAKLRSAVSRAYYAAFCSARNHAISAHGATFPGSADAHSLVRLHYVRRPSSGARRVAEYLHMLRKDRNKVDYRDTVSQLPSVTNKCLSRAAKIISDLGST